jgi:hypothetical protein
MRDIQTVTEYFYAVYVLAAAIFGGYAIGIVVAARKATARLSSSLRSPGQSPE